MMATNENESWSRELTKCPECGGSVTLDDGIESNGEGIAYGYVSCGSCGFEAREEWSIQQTVKLDGGNQ